MNLKTRLYLFSKTYLKLLTTRDIKTARQFASDYRILRKMVAAKLANVIAQNKIDNPGVAYQKYLDVDLWVYECLKRVYELGLNTGGKKEILDLGTGAGYFPYICNYYGHHAEALDVPDNDMYNQIIKELEIKRYGQYIQAYKNIDVDNKYDLVTGYMICFNNHKSPNLWHIKEWEYFLKSLSERNMKPGAEIFLSFNPESEEEPVSKELLSYFASHNGKINEHQVFLERSAFLPA